MTASGSLISRQYATLSWCRRRLPPPWTVREDRDRPLIETVKQYLASRSGLLVLDNFEQVLPAAPHLADLLRACPGLKVLVTSRSALHLRWEHELVVDPLAVPDLAALPAPADLPRSPRWRCSCSAHNASIPSSVWMTVTHREIAEICVRLDGLPLAIELAAARMRILPPRALLSRLGRRLVVLDSGPQDQPARQRTLRAALDWSYELLPPAEQALFRRLGVFVGGFALEAVAEVCDPDGSLGIEPVRGVESLVEKSLVRHTRRWRKRGPLRAARDDSRLRAWSSSISMARAGCCVVATPSITWVAPRSSVGQISSAHQAVWLRSLELEHDNLRAALAWCQEAHEPELGLRAAGLLAWFWQVRGHISEGRARLAELLTLAGSSPPALRAEGLRVAASMALCAV